MTTNLPTEKTEKTPKSHNKKLIIGLAIAAVLAAGAGIGIPMGINAAQHSAAVSAYNDATEALTDAQSDVEKALESLTAAQGKAVVDFEAGRALLNAAKSGETYFDPTDSIAVLEEALNALLGTADLAVAEDGAVTANEISVPDASKEGSGLSDEDSTDDLNAGTAEIKKTVKERAAQVKDLTKRADAIDAAAAAAHDASLAVVAAGEKYGTAWARPEKTQDDAWNAYVAAVEAIKAGNLTEESDLGTLVKTYVDARNAAQKSHDDTVAAEEAAARRAAEEAARRAAQQQQQQSWGSSNRSGGSSNSGGGNSGGVPNGRIVPDVPIVGDGGAAYCNDLAARGGSCFG